MWTNKKLSLTLGQYERAFWISWYSNHLSNEFLRLDRPKYAEMDGIGILFQIPKELVPIYRIRRNITGDLNFLVNFFWLAVGILFNKKHRVAHSIVEHGNPLFHEDIL